MLVRNKKNGTNILAFQKTRVIIKAGETINIPTLTSFDQITNKADFDKNRGWFEIVENTSLTAPISVEETNLEKAKKEVKEYTSKQIKED